MISHYQFHCLFIITISHFGAWKSVSCFFWGGEEKNVFRHKFSKFSLFHLSVFLLIPCSSPLPFHILEWLSRRFNLRHAPSSQIWNSSLKEGDTQSLSSLSLITTFPSIGKPQISVLFNLIFIKSGSHEMSSPLSSYESEYSPSWCQLRTGYESSGQSDTAISHCTCYLLACTVPALSICCEAGVV